MVLKTYKREYDYSYSLGVFPTIELLESRPNIVTKVILHTEGKLNTGIGKIINLCEYHKIVFETNDKLIERLSNKENCYAIGVFSKTVTGLSPEKNHIVLVNPGDMGNLGTIIRTSLGFDFTDIAIIKPGVDAFNPKVIRGSMGSFFKVNIEYFDSFIDYQKRFSHDIYTFRLNGKTALNQVKLNKDLPYSLVFGNESSGLGKEYDDIGTGVKIIHSYLIDSLNLAVAVGIAENYFSNLCKGEIK